MWDCSCFFFYLAGVRYYRGQILSGVPGAKRQAPQGIAWPVVEVPVTFLPVAGRELSEGRVSRGVQKLPKTNQKQQKQPKDEKRASQISKKVPSFNKKSVWFWWVFICHIPTSQWQFAPGTSWSNKSEVEAVQELLKNLGGPGESGGDKDKGPYWI